MIESLLSYQIDMKCFKGNMISSLRGSKELKDFIRNWMLKSMRIFKEKLMRQIVRLQDNSMTNMATCKIANHLATT